MKKKARKAAQRAKKLDEQRRQLYENLAETVLPTLQEKNGLRFHAFRHTKIKFSFVPSDLTHFVSSRAVFFVSLRYLNHNWRIKHDTIPANYQWRVYRLFYKQKSFAVDDDNIFETINKIYNILVDWTRQQEKFRQEKFKVISF